MQTYKGEEILVRHTLQHINSQGKMVYQGIVSIVNHNLLWLTKEFDRAEDVDLHTRDQLISENEIQFKKYELIPSSKGEEVTA